jgi:hypothetical protein
MVVSISWLMLQRKAESNMIGVILLVVVGSVVLTSSVLFTELFTMVFKIVFLATFYVTVMVGTLFLVWQGR